jgi:polyisoprenoid-binding protein YceI
MTNASPLTAPRATRLLAPLLLGLAGTLSTAGSAAAAEYAIDANHTQVLFTYSHNGYSHLSARLNQVAGTLEFDPAKPAASSIDVTIPMSSLSTGVPKLDAHMSSADMFDVAQFPTATFKSTSVKVLGKDRLAVAGDLTIHGVTKPATFDVTINSTAPHPMRKTRAVGFDARATIKRSDFGVSFMLPGVADSVQLMISMEAGEPRKAPAPGAAPAAQPVAAPAAAGKGG